MAIIIPSKSVYTPIENEKVVNPIKSVSSEVYDYEIINSYASETIDILIDESFHFEKEYSGYLSKDFLKSSITLKKIELTLDYSVYDRRIENAAENKVNKKLKASFNSDFFGNLKLTTDYSPRYGVDSNGNYDNVYYVSEALSVSLNIELKEEGIYYKITPRSLEKAKTGGKVTESVSDNLLLHFEIVKILINFSGAENQETPKNITYGEKSKSKFSLPSNELIQNQTMIRLPKNGVESFEFYQTSAPVKDEFGNVLTDINGNRYYYYSTVENPSTKDYISGVHYFYYPTETETNTEGGIEFTFDDFFKNTDFVAENISEITNIKIIYDGIYELNYYAKQSISDENNLVVFVTSSEIYNKTGIYVAELSARELFASWEKSFVLYFENGGWRPTNTISDFIAKNVLREYGNGKETAKIRCSTRDYYNESGELSISPNGKDNLPMLFDIGQEVIPMIMDYKGDDVPLSLDKSGNPKIFRIVSINKSDSGALWQDLTLQEK